MKAGLAVLAIALAVEGDILLAQALRAVPLAFGQLGVAVSLLTAHFLLWFYLLARTELSVLMPVTGLYYVFNALLAQAQLGEAMTAQTWAGTWLITGGVLLVTYTPSSSE